MKIFRVTLNDKSEMSLGYQYTSSFSDAKKILREHSRVHDRKPDYDQEIEMKETAIGKYEFLRLLNKWASHPDNG